MKRIKRHRVKTEKPETSATYSQEHDLAYYIHDRVELMHQVFSVLKYKDLKAMAPECVRNLPIGDLQELCTEELLGISSKRLLATLDGCEPPSDTESSSGSPTPDRIETISLDSISSDEEILSQASKKKKHKHRRSSKTKSKKDEKQKARDSKSTDETIEVSKASRAGLTVLELLELQARARAIRAQLQNEQARKQSNTALDADVTNSTDDEVEIKEETPDVVEISSGDEKPDITALQAAAQKSSKPIEPSKPKEVTNTKEISKPKETSKAKKTSKAKETSKPEELEENKDNNSEKTTTVTKRISDIIITVPQAKANRKIKLKRNNVTITVPNVTQTAPENLTVTIKKPTEKSPKVETSIDKSKKKKKNKKKKTQEKGGSDHDEITLQLSDSEKMDLLEDLNEKIYDRLSISSSDSESSSSDSEDTSKENVPSEPKTSTETKPSQQLTFKETLVSELHTPEETVVSELHISKETVQSNNQITETETVNTNKPDTNPDDIRAQNELETNASSILLKYSIEPSNAQEHSKENIEDEAVTKKLSENNGNSIHDKCTDHVTISQDTNQSEIQIEDGVTERQDTDAAVTEEGLTKYTVDKTALTVPDEIDTQEVAESSPEKLSQTEVDAEKEMETEKKIENTTIDNISLIKEDAKSLQKVVTTVDNDNENTDVTAKESERDKSEGELSDRVSSEVEAFDKEAEVVCISDDEKQMKKKKKKKDKKAKKEKKSKKLKQDFREGADQNFYTDADKPSSETFESVDTKPPIDISDIDDDVYETLELSDDSSCYEVEGTVLSKEPTAEEIEALSARIDEIKREDVVNDLTIDDMIADNNEQTKSDESEHETENILSWKDRYLDSKKVKRVLNTANILNALRKKNRELKRKIEEAKNKEKEAQEQKVTQAEKDIVQEGSLEQYQLLQASSTYVNSVTEHSAEEIAITEDEKTVDEETRTREIKKDAKHLMKMFKKLLNSRKEKRREKKKKRKLKKQLDGDAAYEIANLV